MATEAGSGPDQASTGLGFSRAARGDFVLGAVVGTHESSPRRRLIAMRIPSRAVETDSAATKNPTAAGRILYPNRYAISGREGGGGGMKYSDWPLEITSVIHPWKITPSMRRLIQNTVSKTMLARGTRIRMMPPAKRPNAICPRNHPEKKVVLVGIDTLNPAVVIARQSVARRKAREPRIRIERRGPHIAREIDPAWAKSHRLHWRIIIGGSEFHRRDPARRFPPQFGQGTAGRLRISSIWRARDLVPRGMIKNWNPHFANSRTIAGSRTLGP